MSGFCAPWQPGGGAIATLDPTVFQTGGRYPEFNSVSLSLITDYYAEAGDYLNNTGLSPISDVAKQARIMNMITAHIAALYSGINGVAPSGIVGRIATASEGSVSVGTGDLGPMAGTEAWFLQTPYGFSAWNALAPYRRGFYVPGRRAMGYLR